MQRSTLAKVHQSTSQGTYRIYPRQLSLQLSNGRPTRGREPTSTHTSSWVFCPPKTSKSPCQSLYIYTVRVQGTTRLVSTRPQLTVGFETSSKPARPSRKDVCPSSPPHAYGGSDIHPAARRVDRTMIRNPPSPWDFGAWTLRDIRTHNTYSPAGDAGSVGARARRAPSSKLSSLVDTSRQPPPHDAHPTPHASGRADDPASASASASWLPGVQVAGMRQGPPAGCSPRPCIRYRYGYRYRYMPLARLYGTPFRACATGYQLSANIVHVVRCVPSLHRDIDVDASGVFDCLASAEICPRPGDCGRPDSGLRGGDIHVCWCLYARPV